MESWSETYLLEYFHIFHFWCPPINWGTRSDSNIVFYVWSVKCLSEIYILQIQVFLFCMFPFRSFDLVSDLFNCRFTFLVMFFWQLFRIFCVFAAFFLLIITFFNTCKVVEVFVLICFSLRVCRFTLSYYYVYFRQGEVLISLSDFSVVVLVVNPFELPNFKV